MTSQEENLVWMIGRNPERKAAEYDPCRMYGGPGSLIVILNDGVAKTPTGVSDA